MRIYKMEKWTKIMDWKKSRLLRKFHKK